MSWNKEALNYYQKAGVQVWVIPGWDKTIKIPSKLGTLGHVRIVTFMGLHTKLSRCKHIHNLLTGPYECRSRRILGKKLYPYYAVAGGHTRALARKHNGSPTSICLDNDALS